MGKAYNYKHAPAGRWRIGNTHTRSAEGLEPPTRARCAHATNAQKEPRFPRSNHERTLVFPSQSTRMRAAGSSAPSCGRQRHMASPTAEEAARMWLGHLGPRPQARARGHAHRPRTAHMACDAEPLAQKSPARRDGCKYGRDPN